MTAIVACTIAVTSISPRGGEGRRSERSWAADSIQVLLIRFLASNAQPNAAFRVEAISQDAVGAGREWRRGFSRPVKDDDRIRGHRGPRGTRGGSFRSAIRSQAGPAGAIAVAARLVAHQPVNQ